MSEGTELYKQFIEHVDKTFPWFFLSLILFLSTFAGIAFSTFSFTVQTSRNFGMIFIFYMVPLYFSVFPISILSRIQKGNRRLRELLANKIIDRKLEALLYQKESELRQGLIKQEYLIKQELTQSIYTRLSRDMHSFPLTIFLTFIILIATVWAANISSSFFIF